jgi:hypothetical protein
MSGISTSVFINLWTFARRWRIIRSHFIKDGFECVDKAVHVGSSDERRYHLQRLAQIGIDSTTARQSEQFELRANASAQ